jgi:hypothetical protein
MKEVLIELDFHGGQFFIELPEGVDSQVAEQTAYAIATMLKHSYHELTRKIGEAMLAKLKEIEGKEDSKIDLSEYIDPLKFNEG